MSLRTYNKKVKFLETEAAVETEQDLKDMVADAVYCTEPSYSANAKTYPDHSIPFVNKHMEYLSNHPATDPKQYLQNLRLMTKIK